MHVPLNIDLGELPDEPEELYALADVANLACGGHAGDEPSVARAVERCLHHGTEIGAHPGYPDREGFGRRALALAPAELVPSLRAQYQLLHHAARRVGLEVRALKPHGALYHAADADPVLAATVLTTAVGVFGDHLSVFGPRGGALAGAARALSLQFRVEGFADRGVGPDGRLLPRGAPGALRTDPAEAAAAVPALLAAGVGTVCVHGDTPGAVAIAAAVRAALDTAPRARPGTLLPLPRGRG